MPNTKPYPGAPNDNTGTPGTEYDIPPISQRDQLENLDQAADIPEVLANPIYQKLELFLKLFHPTVDPDLETFDANLNSLFSTTGQPEKSKKSAAKSPIRKESNNDITEKALNDGLYLDYLAEFLFRVRKGAIHLDDLITIYDDQGVKEQITTCLELRMDMGMISDGELEHVIRGLVDERIFEPVELVQNARNAKLNFTVRKLYPISGQSKAPIPSSNPPPSGPSGERMLEPQMLGAMLLQGMRASDPLSAPPSTMIPNSTDGLIIVGNSSPVQQAPGAAEQGTDASQKRKLPPPPPQRKIRVPVDASATAETGPPPPPSEDGQRETLVSIDRKAAGKTAEAAIDAAEYIKLTAIIQYDHNGHEISGSSYPLSKNQARFTIGTDPGNDIVISENCGDRISPFHAELGIQNGSIYIRGRAGGGPLKVLDGTDKQLVLTEWVGINEGQQFRVGRSKRKGNDPNQYEMDVDGRLKLVDDDLPIFAVKFEHQVEKKPLSDYFRKRLETLTKDHAYQILLLLSRKTCAPGQRTEDALKIDGELDKEILDLEKKYNQILADATQYGLKLFEKPEQDEKMQSARYLVKKWVLDYLARMIQQHGIDLLEKVESQRKHITENGKPDDLDMILDLPAVVHETLGVCAKYGIEVINDKEIQQLLDEATTKARRAADEIRTQAQSRMIREAEELEASMQPMRDHGILLEEYQQQYAGVHFEEVNELLNEGTRFGYIGPVIKISGPYQFEEAIPFIHHRMALGDDAANSITLSKETNRAHETRPFMVEIEHRTEAGEFVMHWIDGKVEFSANREMPMTPNFKVAAGRKVDVGPYAITIEDNHAYTEKAIKDIGARHAEKLINTIFAREFTSQEQIHEANERLKEMARHNYVEMQAIRKTMTIRMVQLWEEIGSWRPELPAKPMQNIEQDLQPNGSKHLQDAQRLITLNYLLSERGIHFSEINRLQVQAAAKKRMAAYVAASNAADIEGPNTWLDKIGKVFSRSSDTITSERHRAKAKASAEVGKIQIAQFLAAGFVTEDEIKNDPNISPDYINEIQEVVMIRDLFDLFQENGAGVNEIGNLCGQKKMKDIFSRDEIQIAALNIDAGINEEFSIWEYLIKLAVHVARECFRKAMAKEDNSEELAMIKILSDLKLITLSDLIIPPLTTPEFVHAQLDELFRTSNFKRQEAKRAEKLRVERHAILAREAAQLDEKRRALVEKAGKAGDAMERARVETKLEILLEVADIFGDPEVDDEMGREQVQLDMYQLRHDPLEGRESARDRMAAIIAERRTVSWQDMKDEYAALTRKAARDAAEKVTKGDSAAYHHLLLKKAIAKGLIDADLTAFGLDDQKIQEGRQKEQAKLKRAKLEKKYAPLFDQFVQIPFEDFSYLDAIDVNTLTDEDEKRYVAGLMECVSIDKMEIILKNLWDGKDVVYMKLIARKLIRKGFDPNRYFPDHQLALLQ